MSEIRAIVDRLNQPPFELGFSLVSFDEKTPSELLQILNDVLTKLDASHERDVRDEDPSQTGPRIIQFLRVMRYQVPTSNIEEFQKALVNGNRNVIYPILYYLLSKFESLKKRAYVAKFLMTIEIPPEFMHDQAVQEVYQQFRELQVEFKDMHKEVEKLRASDNSPSTWKKDIAQLEEERTQLNQKIAQLKKKTSSMQGFGPLREATSLLRKEQEEESRLQERLMEQRAALQAAEKRYSDTSRRLAETRANTREDITAEQLLQQAQQEAEQNEELIDRILPQTLAARRDTLSRLREALNEPVRTESEISQIRQRVGVLEGRVDAMHHEVTEAHRAAQDEKLSMFHRQSALVTKKRQEKEDELDNLRNELETISRDVEAKEARMSQLAGPQYMRKDEFKAYAALLRDKTNEYKSLKQELAAHRQETVVLARTEQILKSRAHNLDQFLRDLEERRGVAGYTGVQSNLENVSKAKANVDVTKGKTLNEISQIVTSINASLKEKKTRLQPLIAELKALRGEYTEVESRYLKSKSKFDNTRAGLDTERIALERTCDQLQEAMNSEEDRYHELQLQLDLAKERLERAVEEAKFQAGDGRLLRDFASWKELYTNKIGQQEQLAKTLRAQQKDIKENSGAHARQRVRFVDLKRLLELKHTLNEEESHRQAQEDQEAYGGNQYDQLGGANVMTIEQS